MKPGETQAGSMPRTQTGTGQEMKPHLGDPVPEGYRLDGYVLLERIGAGGMGVVYLAEQEKPRRTVAVKFIRAAAMTPELQRRFDHEAFVLGRLQHSGIAQVIEAGAAQTPFGATPYLVMEHVDGLPLTEYANRNRLTIRQRLDLFLRVCEAVQHAHTKGVIHRDLKPSNILVTKDGQPKVLDFGVARVIGGDSPLVTMQTSYGQLVGTLPYMSPEQVAGEPDEVDTRSDVYSLGAVLFELLTGRLPHDVEGKPLPEAARIIREVDAPRLGQFQSAFRGDIEIIAAHALEKDRALRYQGAGDLAADIRRMLSDEPILARPPSAIYQIRKFARRNKGLFAGAMATAAVLLAGIVVSSTLAVAARQAARLAKDRLLDADNARKLAEDEGARSRAALAQTEAALQFLQRMLASVDPEMAAGRDTTLLRDLLRDTERQIESDARLDPVVEATVRGTIGVVYRQLAEYSTARRHLERSYDLRRRTFGEDHLDTLVALAELASLALDEGKYDEAERLSRESLGRRRRTLGEEHVAVAAAMADLAAMVAARGDRMEAERLYRDALAARRRLLGDTSLEVASTLSNLGVLLVEHGNASEGEGLAREALNIRERRLGGDHPLVALSRQNLAVALEALGHASEAEALHRDALAFYRRVYGAEHPLTLKVTDNLGMALTRQQKYREAEPLFRSALDAMVRKLGADHPDALRARNNLGFMLFHAARYAEAREEFRAVLEARLRVLGGDHPDTALSRNNLGKAHERLEEHGPAAECYEEALAAYRKLLPEGHGLIASTLTALGGARQADGRLVEAEAAFREAVEIRRSRGEAEPDELAAALSDLGEVLLLQKKLAEAEPLLLDAYTTWSQARGAQHAATRESAERVAALYAAWGKSSLETEWRAKAGAP